MAARRHASDEHAGVLGVRLHAHAVAQDGATGVGTGRIDAQHAHGAAALADLRGQPIDERALARPGRPGDANQIRAAGLREQAGDERGRAGCFVLDQGNRARDRARIAGQQAVG
jgi:hypothetical protein